MRSRAKTWGFSNGTGELKTKQMKESNDFLDIFWFWFFN